MKQHSTGVTGAISELLVAGDLMQKGFEVFRALSPASSCDLMAYKDHCFLRVEVRTGRRQKSGKVGFAMKAVDMGRHDILALYVPEEDLIIYRPEL